MSQHHDRVVGDALRRLDVPDHGPDFWDRLEGRLADDSDVAGGPAPHHHIERDEQDADVIDLATSTAARRRLADGRRTPMLALAAAVAVVVALVVGTAALDPGADESGVDAGIAGEVDGPGGPDGDGQAPAPSVPDESTDTTMAEPTTTDPEVPAAMTADQAEANAAEWLDRLFAGDVEGAYGLLDDTSRARMPFEEFEQMGAGLFEGAAAFAAGEGISRSVQQLETTAGQVSVVTVSGEVEREGMVETASYPVVLTDTGVHFTLGGPRLELDPEYLDSSGTTLASPLEVIVGEETDAWVGYDGAAFEPMVGRGEVSIDVEEGAGPGTHLVTLLAVQGDLIVARAHTVVVP